MVIKIVDDSLPYTSFYRWKIDGTTGVGSPALPEPPTIPDDPNLSLVLYAAYDHPPYRRYTLNGESLFVIPTRDPMTIANGWYKNDADEWSHPYLDYPQQSVMKNIVVYRMVTGEYQHGIESPIVDAYLRSQEDDDSSVDGTPPVPPPENPSPTLSYHTPDQSPRPVPPPPVPPEMEIDYESTDTSERRSATRSRSPSPEADDEEEQMKGRYTDSPEQL